MKSSNLALQPSRAAESPAEDQPAPGTSAPQGNSLVVSVQNTTPPRILHRRHRTGGIVIRDQGLAPFRVY